MADIDLVRRAGRAHVEMGETFRALDDLRAAAVERWAASRETDRTDRERLHLAVQTIDAIKQHVRAVAESAAHEEAIEAILRRPAEI